MRRVLQILIFAIITVSVPTDSYSFISALTKGGKLLFKGKIWKAGGATGASSIDNVAKQALDIKKIDKNLIDKIGKAEHENISLEITKIVNDYYKEIQKSGGTALSVRAFQNGYAINAGDQLTSQVRQNANC